MRDALPQHEISDIVKRLKDGEDLAAVKRSKRDVSSAWFEVNEASLLRMAGLAGAEQDADDEGEAAVADEPEAPAQPGPKRRGRKPKAQEPAE